jgi:hypothetical protein
LFADCKPGANPGHKPFPLDVNENSFISEENKRIRGTIKGYTLNIGETYGQ